MVAFVQALSMNLEEFNKFTKEVTSVIEEEKSKDSEFLVFINWFEIIPRQPDVWIKTLSASRDLQTYLEKIILKICKIPKGKKFEVDDLPIAANALDCDILYQCPYMYLNLKITADSKNPRCSIVITMNRRDVFKIYFKEENKHNIEYVDKKISMKNCIIKQLITEYKANYELLEKIFTKKTIRHDEVQSLLTKIREFDSAIDELIELKNSEGKKTGANSNLINYLNALKKENQEILLSFSSIPKLPTFEEKKEESNESMSNIPCMDCKKLFSNIVELQCSHTICKGCLEARINDAKSEKKGFVIKCPLDYCFYILKPSEIKLILGDSLDESISSLSIPEYCLICQKRANIRLHDDHSLCNNCLVAYVNYEIALDDSLSKSINQINCPMNFFCNKTFTSEICEKAEGDLKNIVNKKLHTENSDIEEEKYSERLMACFSCGVDSLVSRLHDDCILHFCGKHCNELGQKIHKNKSNL